MTTVAANEVARRTVLVGFVAVLAAAPLVAPATSAEPNDWSEWSKLTVGDAALGFGQSVATSGDMTVVGAYGAANSSGSAFLFDAAGNLSANLADNDGRAHDFFGKSVGASGGTVVIGAPGDDDHGDAAGSAFLFDSSGNQPVKLAAADAAATDQFGWSVAISGDRVVVGAPGDDSGSAYVDSGSAYVFDRSGGQLAKLTAPDAEASDMFGRAVAISGDRIVVGAPQDRYDGYNYGSAYVFDLSGQQVAKLTPADAEPHENSGFGESVAISGATVVVGAPNDFEEGTVGPRPGAAYVFDTSGSQLAKLVPSSADSYDYVGGSVAVSGETVVVGAVGDDDRGGFAGAAFVFNGSGLQQAKLTASDGSGGDFFGRSVAIAGETLVAGAEGSRSAYVFKGPSGDDGAGVTGVAEAAESLVRDALWGVVTPGPTMLPFEGQFDDNAVGCIRDNGCAGGYHYWTDPAGARHLYWAIDFTVPVDTPVYAAGDGAVTSWEGCPPYDRVPTCGTHNFGNAVKIVHPDGSESWYGHLATVTLKSGPVRAGQQIGTVGNSGNSDGAHLHYEERPANGAWGTQREPVPKTARHDSRIVTYPEVWGYSNWGEVPCGRHAGEVGCTSTWLLRNDG